MSRLDTLQDVVAAQPAGLWLSYQVVATKRVRAGDLQEARIYLIAVVL